MFKMKDARQKPKATGWKVPLIFCGAIILIATAINFFLQAKAELPAISPDLLELAKNRKIDLDNREGKPWKDRIVNAASGFSPRENKDARLALIIEDALAQNRFDAACAAVVLLNGGGVKNASLKMIFNRAIASCGDAPWAVFAIHAMGNQKEAAEMISALEEKWLQCPKK